MFGIGVFMGNVPSSPLVEILGKNSSAELLVYLVYNHSKEFTVNDIVEKTGITKAKVSKMKEALLKYKVIEETKKEGKISYYKYKADSKFGNLLYALVLNASAVERATPSEPLQAASQTTPQQPKMLPSQPKILPPQSKKDDSGNKMIIV
jgi:DNA-binding transcriptional regulator GbsR (MarR family)